MKGEKGDQMLETMKGRVAHRRKGDEGFTLIELLVVIVILAILAAIVVFAVGGIGDKGQESACSTDLKTIQTAQEAFFANSRGARHDMQNRRHWRCRVPHGRREQVPHDHRQRHDVHHRPRSEQPLPRQFRVSGALN